MEFQLKTRSKSIGIKAERGGREGVRMKAIHIISRREGISLRGLKRVEGTTYRSCCWAFSKEEAESLIGAWLFLHPVAKSEPSEFGGIIKGVEPAKRDGDVAIKDGYAFIVEAKKQGKGRRWQGADHYMAWNSGVIEIEDPEA
jgi:hypothetical protein